MKRNYKRAAKSKTGAKQVQHPEEEAVKLSPQIEAIKQKKVLTVDEFRMLKQAGVFNGDKKYGDYNVYPSKIMLLAEEESKRVTVGGMRAGAVGARRQQKKIIEEIAPLTAEQYKKLLPRESEHEIQAACVAWFRTAYAADADHLRAIPNGGTTATKLNTKTGKRYSIEGQRFKREGLVPGTPDLFLSIPKMNYWRSYFGLWIEMKAPDGTLSPAQLEQLQKLEERQYACAVCYTRDQFIETVKRYYEILEMPHFSSYLPPNEQKKGGARTGKPARKCVSS